MKFSEALALMEQGEVLIGSDGYTYRVRNEELQYIGDGSGKWLGDDVTDLTHMLQITYEKYEKPVDWSKVEVDTKILVSDSRDDKSFVKRHFAKYRDGIVWVWNDGGTSWTSNFTTPWKYARLPKE